MLERDVSEGGVVIREGEGRVVYSCCGTASARRFAGLA